MIPQKSVGPGNEVLPVGSIGVAAIVLPPGELPVKQPDVDGRHFRVKVIVPSAQVSCSKQSKDRPRRHGGHEASFMIEPCLLYTSPSPRDRQKSRMPSSA